MTKSSERTEETPYAGYGGYYSTPEEASASIREHAAEAKSESSGGGGDEGDTIEVYIGETSTGQPIYREVKVSDIAKGKEYIAKRYGRKIAESIEITETDEGISISYPTGAEKEYYVPRETIEKITGKHYAGLSEEVPLWQAKQILMQEGIKFKETEEGLEIETVEYKTPEEIREELAEREARGEITREGRIRRELEARGVPIFKGEKIDWEEKILLGGLVLGEKIAGREKGTIISGARKALGEMVSGAYITGYAALQLAKRPKKTWEFITKGKNLKLVTQETKEIFKSWGKEFKAMPTKEKIGYATTFLATTLVPTKGLKGVKLKVSEARLKFGGLKQGLISEAVELAGKKYRVMENVYVETGKVGGTVTVKKPTILTKFKITKTTDFLPKLDTKVKLGEKVKVRTRAISGEIFKYKGKGKAERIVTETELPTRYRKGKVWVEVPERGAVKIEYEGFEPSKVTRVKGKESFLKSKEARVRLTTKGGERLRLRLVRREPRLRRAIPREEGRIRIYERVGEIKRPSPLRGLFPALSVVGKSLKGLGEKSLLKETTKTKEKTGLKLKLKTLTGTKEKQTSRLKLETELKLKEKIRTKLRIRTETKGKRKIKLFGALPSLRGGRAKKEGTIKAYVVYVKSLGWIQKKAFKTKSEALRYGANLCLKRGYEAFKVVYQSVTKEQIGKATGKTWKTLRKKFIKKGNIYIKKK